MFKLYVLKYEENYIKTNNKSILEHINSYNTIQREISLFAYSKLEEYLFNDFNYKIDKIYFDGKPSLNNNSLFFNISHDHEIIAIIISNTNCGIDITRIVKSPKIALKILSNEELEEYNNASNKELYLTKKWAMKEAYYKYKNINVFDKTINLDIIEYEFDNIKYYLSYKVGEENDLSIL